MYHAEIHDRPSLLISGHDVDEESAKATSDERAIRGMRGIRGCWKMPAKLIINAVD
jgi:hypothetical protein